MHSVRNEQGAAAGLVAVLSVVLAMLIAAFFHIALFFGASDETRNATDAGALNVGQQALNISTTAQNPAERQFDDVADKNGRFTLTNINRVWGKALLANLNASAMNAEGYGTGRSSQHADALFQGASGISDRLAGELGTSSHHHTAFDQFSTQNRLSALGGKAKTTADSKTPWETSLVDRGAESNITFDKDQLPSKADLAAIGPVSGQDGNLFVPGYKPIKVMDKVFFMVPFKQGEKPHLISGEKFASNTRSANPLADWKNPVPNAFSAKGATSNGQSLVQTAVSFVQTNPQRKFDLLMPHAYVRIKLDQNSVRYFHNLIPRSAGNYAFQPEEQVQGPFDAGSGTATVNASLGYEYVPPTLFQAIYALPGDHREVTKVLLQRCREMKKDLSTAEFFALLQMPLVPYVNEYLIFPVNKKLLVVAPNIAAKALASWIDLSAKADGSEKEIATEFAAGFPNSASVTLAGAGQIVIPPFALTFEHGHLKWRPGTGYDGCLGELFINRDTEVLSFGYMVPLP